MDSYRKPPTSYSLLNFRIKSRGLDTLPSLRAVFCALAQPLSLAPHYLSDDCVTHHFTLFFKTEY